MNKPFHKEHIVKKKKPRKKNPNNFNLVQVPDEKPPVFISNERLLFNASCVVTYTRTVTVLKKKRSNLNYPS